MSCKCCCFIQPDSAISRNRKGSRDFVEESNIITALHRGPVGELLQIYADRFSGNYAIIITGMGGGVTHATKVTLTIHERDSRRLDTEKPGPRGPGFLSFSVF